MKVITVLIAVCFGAEITSSALNGIEITASKKWWNDNFFVKFNSPIGKTFYINFFDGTIDREKGSESLTVVQPGVPVMIPSETEIPLNVGEKLPFISFVSIDFRIYDIYFESDDINSFHPRLVETEFVNKYQVWQVRPRLYSFVGPNKKVYEVIYNDCNKVDVTEKTPETLDHFQIKTFGPYEKWEHTYDFSEDGENVVDHTISAIPVLANRSILLTEVEPNSFRDEKFSIRTFVKFNSPSGTKYHATNNELNIAPITYDDVVEIAYITFTEPNGRTYDILLDEEDGHPSLVLKSVDDDYFRRIKERLYSFVTPNGILYQIDHKNESDHEVPVLVSNSSDSTDLQITLIKPTRYYNKYVKYIFLDSGKKIFDRVDEVDWTPLKELPALPVEEVTQDYVKTNLPYLTLYTPSGNNYHIFRTGESASIAVEKGSNNSQSLYISYLPAGGRKTNIHFVSGADPYLGEEVETDKFEEIFSFTLLSFSTPDQKKYSITTTWGEEWKPSIQLPLQVHDPNDLAPVDGLFIKMSSEYGTEFIYRFTWNGDKLVEVSTRMGPQSAPVKLVLSLIGK